MNNVSDDAQGVKHAAWYSLKLLDGRTLSETSGIFDRWQWILDNITTNAECHENEVDVEEAEEGDFITVRGARYATVSREIV